MRIQPMHMPLMTEKSKDYTDEKTVNTICSLKVTYANTRLAWDSNLTHSALPSASCRHRCEMKINENVPKFTNPVEIINQRIYSDCLEGQASLKTF